MTNEVTTDRNGYVMNQTDALFAIADAINHLAKMVDRLGVNGASTPMGAIEALGMEMKNGFELLANAVFDSSSTEQNP